MRTTALRSNVPASTDAKENIVKTLRLEPAAGRPYVPGLLTDGGIVFVSGQIPLRSGTMVDGSIEDQTDAVFDNIEAILADANAALDDVVRCGVFIADLDDLAAFNAVYTRRFGGHLPTRTTVGAHLPGYGVEIDCIAVVPRA
jgi:2-iminobutanoate/2-iminopropanoate deaminase